MRPSSHVAVDEFMIAFQGRSSHTVKMKGKRTKDGFKLLAHGYRGFIHDWLFHSPV